jgi:purine catabolism regulator
MGEELVKSLDAYYAAGQSIAAAARSLFVHRHTLEYRLSRIETLLARDIRSPNERLLLELALAIREKNES